MLKKITHRNKKSAMGAFAFISHQVDSSQQPQTNVDLVSHPFNQNAPFKHISKSAGLQLSPCNDCLFASCLQNPLTRYLELNQGALANIFQMSLPEAWHFFRSAEHQNFLETWRRNCCCSAF